MSSRGPFAAPVLVPGDNRGGVERSQGVRVHCQWDSRAVPEGNIKFPSQGVIQQADHQHKTPLLVRAQPIIRSAGMTWIFKIEAQGRTGARIGVVSEGHQNPRQWQHHHVWLVFGLGNWSTNTEDIGQDGPKSDFEEGDTVYMSFDPTTKVLSADVAGKGTTARRLVGDTTSVQPCAVLYTPYDRIKVEEAHIFDTTGAVPSRPNRNPSEERRDANGRGHDFGREPSGGPNWGAERETRKRPLEHDYDGLRASAPRSIEVVEPPAKRQQLEEDLPPNYEALEIEQLQQQMNRLQTRQDKFEQTIATLTAGVERIATAVAELSHASKTPTPQTASSGRPRTTSPKGSSRRESPMVRPGPSSKAELVETAVVSGDFGQAMAQNFGKTVLGGILVSEWSSHKGPTPSAAIVQTLCKAMSDPEKSVHLRVVAVGVRLRTIQGLMIELNFLLEACTGEDSETKGTALCVLSGLEALVGSIEADLYAHKRGADCPSLSRVGMGILTESGGTIMNTVRHTLYALCSDPGRQGDLPREIVHRIRNVAMLSQDVNDMITNKN